MPTMRVKRTPDMSSPRTSEDAKFASPIDDVGDATSRAGSASRFGEMSSSDAICCVVPRHGGLRA